MLLSRYFRQLYLHACVVVCACFLAMIMCITMIRELSQTNNAYTLTDALTYTVQTLPVNIGRFYPVILALGALTWIAKVRDSQELLLAHAVGLGKSRIVIALMPMLLILIVLGTMSVDWIGPVLGAHAKQEQTLARSQGQLMNTHQNMWLKTNKGLMRATTTKDNETLVDIYEYTIHKNEITSWSFAPRATWQDKHWVVENQTVYSLKDKAQKKKHRAKVFLSLHISPEVLEKSSMKTDYYTLPQLWSSVKSGRLHGVLDRVTWVNLWLRVLNPVRTILLVGLVLIYMQASLDLRSANFSKWLIFSVVILIADFTIVEAFEAIKWQVDMWQGLAIASIPIGYLTVGLIGGMYVRN